MKISFVGAFLGTLAALAGGPRDAENPRPLPMPVPRDDIGLPPVNFELTMVRFSVSF